MKLKIKLISVMLILCIICIPVYASDDFTVTYQSITNGQTNVSINPALEFVFNHRIDPCGNKFTLNGSSSLISSYKINGTNLSIYLAGSLEYNTTYTLSIACIKSLYDEKTPLKSISFTTQSKGVTAGNNMSQGYGNSISIGGGVSGGNPSLFTVSFVTNGAVSIPNQSLWLNSCVTKPADPVREGYYFAGWYTDEALTHAYSFNTKVASSFSLYAKWTDTPTEFSVAGFADVKTDDWFSDAVKFVCDSNLMKGISDSEFSPNTEVTRAMLVTVLYRLENEPGIDGGLDSISFYDISQNSYYENAVIWAYQNNIVNGISQTQFAPDLFITREQMAAIICRYASHKGKDDSIAEEIALSAYDDYSAISEYALIPMQYMVSKGLMQGRTSSTLNPGDTLTRAEMATIIKRFIEA